MYIHLFTLYTNKAPYNKSLGFILNIIVECLSILYCMFYVLCVNKYNNFSIILYSSLVCQVRPCKI